MTALAGQYLRFAALASAVVAIDQGIKALVVHFLKGAAPIEVVSGLFRLCYVENRGAAWGLFQGAHYLLAAFALVAIVWLLIEARKSLFKMPLGVTGSALFAGGAMGNMLDRLIRGKVIDFLDFHWGVHHFPAFNFADSCICVAAAFFLFSSLLRRGDKSAE